MVSVKAEKGESSDSLIKRFRNKMKKSGIIEEFINRRYYKKPSDKRREDKKRRRETLNKLKTEHKEN
jgi:small subunit ribosomal protein S21